MAYTSMRVSGCLKRPCPPLRISPYAISPTVFFEALQPFSGRLVTSFFSGQRSRRSTATGQRPSPSCSHYLATLSDVVAL